MVIAGREEPGRNPKTRRGPRRVFAEEDHPRHEGRDQAGSPHREGNLDVAIEE